MHGVPAWQEADRGRHEWQVKLSSMGEEEARKRELAEREAAIRAAMKAVEADVARLETNARAEARVEELREGLSECAQKVADQEQVLYLVEELIKAKMDMLSDLINSKFSHVRFRLFDRQINGAVKETCVMQIASNGSYVDYQNANNAAQIQGGLDVIEALSKLYSVNAPIWIDNRESVTEIPDMDAQIINLIVSPEDKALRVEWK
jgi:predicted ATPase